jgi:hypothetical protein
MMHSHIVFKLTCLLSVLLQLVGRDAQALTTLGQSADCAGNHCSYLPLIAKPIPVVVVNSHLETTGRAGVIYVVGEIRNEINVPLRDIIVRAKIYRDDQFIHEVQQKAIIPATLPGQLNIYNMYSGLLGGGAVLPRVRASIDVLTTTTDTYEDYRNLTVENITTGLFTLTPGTTVTVTVKNSSLQSLNNIRMWLWTRSGCGFTACSSILNVPDLEPGQTHTATVNWQLGSDGQVIPASAIYVVAQGTIWP